MDLVTKTKEYFNQYLKRFKERDESFGLMIEVRTEGNVGYNAPAYEDLEIEVVHRKVDDGAHSWGVGNEQQQYNEHIFLNPTNDTAVLVERQEAIGELMEDKVLAEWAQEVKLAGDRFQHDKHFSHDMRDEHVQRLERANLLVNLIEAITAPTQAKSAYLTSIQDFGARFAADEGFQKVKEFMNALYREYDLGNATAKMRCDLGHGDLESVENRRHLYATAEKMIEITGRLLDEERFEGFLNNEAEGVNLKKTLEERKGFYNKILFVFEGGLDNFQRTHNSGYHQLTDYWLDLINEAVYAKLPEAELHDSMQTLGFLIGAAKVQREWAERGVPVTRPTFLPMEEKRTVIEGGYNTTLMKALEAEDVVTNDIISDKDRNVFVVTGPNNGGKTTYIRHVGQAYWLSHIGMWLPAEKAELSTIDGIFTSYTYQDDTEQGTGLYLTELKRVKEFTNPSNGNHASTPYSVVFFDEFANGTDHVESVEATKIVLEHLVMKGITAYFTTHKQEIADAVETGELPHSMNLAVEARQNGSGIEFTHRVIRDARERSYGNLQREAIGITREGLYASLEKDIRQGKYAKDATRVGELRKR
ncbi:hypothetical protein JXB02_01530 [Candidatus Woesearchaeota archaeon]|nr:hypothetical protein [Candidatus Woesearchaeota archaeon]